MVLASFLILNEAPDRSMRPVFSEVGETVKLFEQFLMLTTHLQYGSVTCLRNPSRCCDTSSGCSLTRILLCSIPHLVLEVRCERLNRLVPGTSSASKSTPSSRKSPKKR